MWCSVCCSMLQCGCVIVCVAVCCSVGGTRGSTIHDACILLTTGVPKDMDTGVPKDMDTGVPKDMDSGVRKHDA